MSEQKIMRKLLEAFDAEPITENDSAMIAEELRGIQEQMIELCRNALQLVGQGGGHTERARLYWYGHIMSALGSEDYPRGGSPTMEDSIDELNEAAEDDDHDYHNSLDDEMIESAAIPDELPDPPNDIYYEIMDEIKAALKDGEDKYEVATSIMDNYPEYADERTADIWVERGHEELVNIETDRGDYEYEAWKDKYHEG